MQRSKIFGRYISKLFWGAPEIMRFDFFQHKANSLQRYTGIVICLFLAACVSSKVEPDIPESVLPSSQLSLSEDEMRTKKLREAAIEDIHAKAQAVPYNEEAPDNGYLRAGETSLLTPEQIAEKIKKIKSTSEQIPPTETAQDVEARQRRIDALRRKGRNHYNTALKNIEAE